MKLIYNNLLEDIVYGALTKHKVDMFCKTKIVTIKNTNNRAFPRYSKTVFTKWHSKGYSDISKYARIVEAIENGTVNELHHNLKTLAKRINIDNG